MYDTINVSHLSPNTYGAVVKLSGEFVFTNKQRKLLITSTILHNSVPK